MNPTPVLRMLTFLYRVYRGNQIKNELIRHPNDDLISLNKGKLFMQREDDIETIYPGRLRFSEPMSWTPSQLKPVFQVRLQTWF